MVRIAVVAGDGIGLEVMPPALSCLRRVAELFEFDIEFDELGWGSTHYRRTGRMMPVDGIDRLATCDAILLGAVGDPDIPDTETLWGLLIPIRRSFDQYVNLRPVRTMPGVPSPLSSGTGIDFVIVRENTEGEYTELGGRAGRGTAEELAVQEALFTRRGITRIARYAAELALRRRGRLVSATKSNGIIHTMPFWDEVVAETVANTGVEVESILIDALAARLVLDPGHFDVIVASNLFGDILSDLGSALTGSIGIAPSGNIDPEHRHPSMFEPVHGSAPDIAGLGVANPVGQLWSAAMMLKHLGHAAAGDCLFRAIEMTLAAGVATPDIGGTASTAEVSIAVLDALPAAAAAGPQPGRTS